MSLEIGEESRRSRRPSPAAAMPEMLAESDACGAAGETSAAAHPYLDNSKPLLRTVKFPGLARGEAMVGAPRLPRVRLRTYGKRL